MILSLLVQMKEPKGGILTSQAPAMALAGLAEGLVEGLVGDLSPAVSDLVVEKTKKGRREGADPEDAEDDREGGH